MEDSSRKVLDSMTIVGSDRLTKGTDIFAKKFLLYPRCQNPWIQMIYRSSKGRPPHWYIHRKAPHWHCRREHNICAHFSAIARVYTNINNINISPTVVKQWCQVRHTFFFRLRHRRHALFSRFSRPTFPVVWLCSFMTKVVWGDASNRRPRHASERKVQ